MYWNENRNTQKEILTSNNNDGNEWMVMIMDCNDDLM